MTELRFGGVWRHKKRHSEYIVLGTCTLQCKHVMLDNTQCVLYIGQDGRMWVRPIDEFIDGRFEEIKLTGKDDDTDARGFDYHSSGQAD